MRQIVDCFAEYERAIIRARTRSALAVKKARGERIGGIPFGYQLAGDGRTLEPHPGEQQALALLRELRAAGHTCIAVADALNSPCASSMWAVSRSGGKTTSSQPDARKRR